MRQFIWNWAGKVFAGFLSMQKCPPKLCQQLVVKKLGHNFTRDQISPPLAVFGVVEIWYVVKIQQWTDFSSASLEILGVVNLAALSTPPTRLERISCPQCGNMSVHILQVWTRTSERSRVEGMRKYFGHKSASRCERSPNYLRTHCPQYLWIFLEI